MNLTVKTTGRELQELYLGAIENNNLEEFRINLLKLIEDNQYHYLAYIYLARVNDFLGNISQAVTAYRKAISLFNPIKGELWIPRFRNEIINFSKKNNLSDLLKEFDDNIYKKTPQKQPINIPKTQEKFATNYKFEKGKKEYTSGNFINAMKLFKECEKNETIHKPSLYINMSNTALALHEYNETKKYIDIGLNLEDITEKEQYALYTVLSSVNRNNEKWSELIKTNKKLLANSDSKKRQISSMQALIEAYLKNEDIENSKNWIEELLSIDPNNKIARKLLIRLSTLEIEPQIDEEDLLKLGEEFAVEIESSKEFELSQMLEVEIENHKFSDAEILKKGEKPTLDDAERLFNKADKSLNEAIRDNSETFVFYPLYLEAAKAFSKLPSDLIDSTIEKKFQRCLSRYSSFRAGAFYTEFKNKILENDKTITAKNSIRKLKDSADSYYIESLRLELDKNEKIAEEIVDNYIKLNAIYSWFQIKKSISVKYFEETFRQTANRCLQFKESKRVICNALLNIGAANPENFNIIFGTRRIQQRILDGQPRAFIWNNRSMIIKEFILITNFQRREEIKGINKLLTKLFEKRKIETDKINSKIYDINIIDFNSTTIQQLSEEWLKLREEQGVFCETDNDIHNQINDIINEFKPYLQRSENEQRGIIDYINEQIINIQKELKNNPTYWGRIGFEPILYNWKSSIKRIIKRRSKAIQPKLLTEIDPPKIVVSGDYQNGSINMIVKNIGTATASSLNLAFSLYTLGDSKLIFKTNTYELGEDLSAGDKTILEIPFNSEEIKKLVEISTFKAKMTMESDFKGENLSFTNEETIDILESTRLVIEDIPWHETASVKPELFKGRDELIDDLEKHYISRDRIETYILYGLTRHGKSSIHKYLSKRLFLKKIITEKGEKKFLPFFWSFANAASSTNAKDMWLYLIGDSILDKLKNYIEDNKIPNELENNNDLLKFINRPNYRNIHLLQILKLLNNIGYIPFIAIDEFTFYTDLIDKGLITPSFLQQIREITIDQQMVCFIFAGIYDIIDILKDPKYGITSQLANTIEYQVGPIDEKSASELINVIEDKLKFTEEAVSYIREVTNNIPYFIQIICRRCGWYAVETGRSIIGKPEIEKIIAVLTGENDKVLAGEVKRLKSEFNNTQFRIAEKYHNAVISTIALHSKGKSNPVSISHYDIIQIWGAHRTTKDHKGSSLGNFQGKLTEALEDLKNRGVIIEDRKEGVPMYKLSVDLFRRWWTAQYPDLDIELDKLIAL
jgi:predicted DNA-binding protein (UPF0278 family)